MQNLLGRTRYLWERNIALQLQVHALTEEREDLVRRQTSDLETTLGLHNKVAELRRERDRLQQQLARRSMCGAPSYGHHPSVHCLRSVANCPGMEGYGR